MNTCKFISNKRMLVTLATTGFVVGVTLALALAGIAFILTEYFVAY